MILSVAATRVQDMDPYKANLIPLMNQTLAHCFMIEDCLDASPPNNPPPGIVAALGVLVFQAPLVLGFMARQGR
eukprot:14358149-Alexandrium_andersonii.AAC.1